MSVDFDIGSAVETSGSGVNQTIPTTQFDITSARGLDELPMKKQSPISAFLRTFVSAPIEIGAEHTAEVEAKAGINPDDSLTVKQAKLDKLVKDEAEFRRKRTDELFRTGTMEMTPEEKAREKELELEMQFREQGIIAEGVGRQLQVPMQVAVATAAIANPLTTAAAVGTFTLADHFFNARRMLEEHRPDADPLLLDVVEIVDFVAKGAAIGKGIQMNRDAAMQRMIDLNLPTAVRFNWLTLKETPAEMLTELGVTPEQLAAAEKAGLPISVPFDNVLKLAEKPNWGDSKDILMSRDQLNNEVVQKVIRDEIWGQRKPFTDPMSPKVFDFLYQFMPSGRFMNLDAEHRLELANSPVKEIIEYAQFKKGKRWLTVSPETKALVEKWREGLKPGVKVETEPTGTPKTPSPDAQEPAGATIAGQATATQPSGAISPLHEAAKGTSTLEEFLGKFRTLYHGGKAKFDKFAAEMMGTGEGGDLFGKAFYLTDQKSLADFYAVATAKKDFVEKYTNTGILGTPEPVYKPGAAELAKQKAVVNEFMADSGMKVLDVDTYKIEPDVQQALVKALTDRGFPQANAEKMVQERIDYARTSPDKINKFRGELDYILQQIAAGDPAAVKDVIDVLKGKGYEAIKYKTDVSYEGAGGYNYAIFSPEKILTKEALTKIWQEAHTEKPTVLEGILGDKKVMSVSKMSEKGVEDMISSSVMINLAGNKAKVQARFKPALVEHITKGVKTVIDLMAGAKSYGAGWFRHITGQNYQINEWSNERFNLYKNVQNPETQPRVKQAAKDALVGFQKIAESISGISPTGKTLKQWQADLTAWFRKGTPAERAERYALVQNTTKKYGEDLLAKGAADNWQSPESSGIYFFLQNTGVRGVKFENGKYTWSQPLAHGEGELQAIKIGEDKLARIDEILDADMVRYKNSPLTQEDGWTKMDKVTAELNSGKLDPKSTVVPVDPQYLNPADKGTYSVGREDTTWEGHKKNLEEHLLPLVKTGVKIIYTNDADPQLMKWMDEHEIPYNIIKDIGKRDEVISFINYEPVRYSGKLPKGGKPGAGEVPEGKPAVPGQAALPGAEKPVTAPEPTPIAPEPPQPLKTPGLTGEKVEPGTTPSGLVQSIARDLGIFDKGNATFGHEERNMEEVAGRVSKYIENNYDRAWDVIRKKVPEPEGLYAEEIFTGLRRKAIAEDDVETLHKLMNTEISAKIATELGQRVKALDVAMKSDVWKLMKDVDAERVEAAKKKMGIDAFEKALKDDYEGLNLKVQDAYKNANWEKFIRGLEC